MSHSRARAASAASLRLTVLLGVAGTMHFLAPRFFDAIVPRSLPGSARTYTYASGVAELGIAGLLATPRTRRTGGALAALLFVAVFPANVRMAADWYRDPERALPLKAGVLLRLPLQVPLVTEAVKVARTG
ncbi:DoxX family protein [Nocardia otitidiscaviarum]|nr:MauE/DoxX family redox-associated membrane protein [Nocardia otitidiscaviarum]MBF6239243.1 hypothetical protein [Nocardia otitidiscaviarum]